MPGDEVDDTTVEVGEPATDGEVGRRADGTAGGAGSPAVEWLARRLSAESGKSDPPAETSADVDEPAADGVHAAEARRDADGPGEDGVHAMEARRDADGPGEDGVHAAEAWPDFDGPTERADQSAETWRDADEPTEDGGYPTGTWADVDQQTGEWPAPGIEDWAEEATDPAGYAHVYGPPSDPFDEEEPDDVLPGWEAPTDQHPTVGRRRILVLAGVFLALAALVGVILLTGRDSAGVERAAGGRNGGGVPAGDQGAAPGDDQGAPAGSPVSAPVGGRTAATFELVDGAAAVQVRAGDLGDDLYRITTPDGSGVTPKVVDESGALRLYLPAGTHGGASAVTIQLSTAVRWTVRVHGGANRTQIDLNGAQVDAVDLEGGANRIDLALPAPKAVTAVRMSGGVDQFYVRLAGGTPVRVRVQDGAGRVTLAGDTQTGIAPGREFKAFGWTPGGTGVDLTAAAGMSGLTVSLG